MRKIAFLSLIILFISCVQAKADQYIAFSLKTAHNRLQLGDSSSVLLNMGGITHPVAAIYDKVTDDVIIVGKIMNKHRPVSLDDWSVALRAQFKVNKDPAVSIDRTKETDVTGMQHVRFSGGLENTVFGNDLLAADIILKRLALNTLKAPQIFNLDSYLDLSINEYNQNGINNSIVSRFWFLPDKNHTGVTAQKGYIQAEEYRILVQNQVMYENKESSTDLPAELFAKNLYANFQDIKHYYPELSRMEQLYYTTALAQGLEASGMAQSPTILYWINDYPVKKSTTSVEYPVEKNSAIAMFGGQKQTIEVSGGIDFDVTLYQLKSGDIDAIKKYVITSRPNPNSLSWDVPLFESVKNENYDPSKLKPIEKSKRVTSSFGTSIKRAVLTPLTPQPSFTISHDRPLSANVQPLTFNHELPNTIKSYSPNVGGVMLQGAAKVSGSDSSTVNLASGTFSLIVDGSNKSRLDPAVYNKFVTALWSVFFSEEPPGISIDPIAPKVNKHLVRYIGNVINNDLGRVMREADYTMKKWAVGTVTPDLLGFKTPTQYALDRDELQEDYSRFWFVPEEMKFNKTEDNALVFESGRMTLKTETFFAEQQGESIPANDDFAQYFTENYHEIAKKYPVYNELYEYSKLVSFAQYLKQNNIPLLWFLMANKDLIITEDSPGTVNELVVKGLRGFPGFQIKGGVNLNVEMGKYVYDQKAVTSINEAFPKLPGNKGKAGTSQKEVLHQQVAEPILSKVDQQAFTVLPQQSMSSGKDRLGNLYQTDIALRKNGQPGLELVRYFKPEDPTAGEYGNGWHLLIPYKIKPLGIEKVNPRLPNKMVLKDLITDQEEVLVLNKTKYPIVGYVPDATTKSQILGLFVMSNGTYRLADKLGNEYHFDQRGYMTDMLLGSNFDLHYTYDDSIINSIENVSYTMEVSGDERVVLSNLSLPKKFKVFDKINNTSEIFEFQPNPRFFSYIPEKGINSEFKTIELLSNGLFKLIDKGDNNIAFDQSGNFVGMNSGEHSSRVVKSVSQGNKKIEFTYSQGKNKHLLISHANLIIDENYSKPAYTVNYYYDNNDRLAKAEKGVGNTSAVRDVKLQENHIPLVSKVEHKESASR